MLKNKKKKNKNRQNILVNVEQYCKIQINKKLMLIFKLYNTKIL